MQVSASVQEGAAVLQLSGTLTAGPDGELLRDAVRLALLHGKQNVVLDLAELVFLDSAGLGEIVACHRRLREERGGLALAAPRGKVRDLLDVTRVAQFIPVRASVHEAIEELARGSA